MSVLVIVEHNNQQIHPSIRPTLSAALQIDSKVTLCVIGTGCSQVAEEASTLGGVEKVWVADHPCYQHLLAENLSEFIVSVSHSFTHVLMAATTFGKNILPRVAALLDVTQTSDVLNIIALDTFERPIYAGNAIETVQVLDNIKVITIRPTAFSSVTEKQIPCSIEPINQIFEANQTTYIDCQQSVSSRPELTNAKIVVSGGRALQNKDNFHLIETLADTLGAAVGASRAAVDAGIVPNDYQVGQTGKVVAPMLYIAVGISGAIQHVAGMKDSKVIVAINKDPDAPIFQIADYGIVGDLFVVIPELIAQLKQELK